MSAFLVGDWGLGDCGCVIEVWAMEMGDGLDGVRSTLGWEVRDWLRAASEGGPYGRWTQEHRQECLCHWEGLVVG